MELDTIAAISTPIGEGAIAIVRISGENALLIADQLFRSPSGKQIKDVLSHTIHYGHLVDPISEQVIEEVMISVLHAPNTFTRENVVEINCHGGIVSVQKVLQVVLQAGARLAEPGEFTKRAFLNGRIDLSQAEAVMDLIRARTDKAANMALQQIEGKLSGLIKKLRQEILEALAQVEVNIDYPEYDDVEEMSHLLMKEKATSVHKEIVNLLKTANHGKIIREGISTAIVGRPNVGKSSLLNSLLRENKAIVTDIPGTTRDVIEEYVNVAGVPLKLIDTAGIRETTDVVEQIGVERTHQALQTADLVLHVIDYSEPLSKDDESLLKTLSNKNLIVILNKTDLPMMVDEERIKQIYHRQQLIYTSVLEGKGIEQLEEAIANLFFQGSIGETTSLVVSNARHIGLLHAAKQSVEDALISIEKQMPIDIVQIDMVKAWEQLGEIIGESVQDDLINQLFSQFCLGK